MRGIFACFFALVILTPSSALPQALSGARYQVPPARNDGWKTTNSDSLGVDSTRLAALTESIRAGREPGVHAILIERDGRLIYEEYFDGLDERWGVPLGRVSMTAVSEARPSVSHEERCERAGRDRAWRG